MLWIYWMRWLLCNMERKSEDLESILVKHHYSTTIGSLWTNGSLVRWTKVLRTARSFSIFGMSLPAYPFCYSGRQSDECFLFHCPISMNAWKAGHNSLFAWHTMQFGFLLAFWTIWFSTSYSTTTRGIYARQVVGFASPLDLLRWGSSSWPTTARDPAIKHWKRWASSLELRPAKGTNTATFIERRHLLPVNQQLKNVSFVSLRCRVEAPRLWIIPQS